MNIDDYLLKDFLKIVTLISQDQLYGSKASVLINDIEKIFQTEEVYVAVFRLDSKNESLIRVVNSPVRNERKTNKSLSDTLKYKFSSKYISYLAKPNFIPNIREDYRWQDFEQLIDHHSFKSSWTIPLESSNQELLGIVTVCFYDFYTPNVSAVKYFKKYSKLLSVALELMGDRKQLYNSRDNYSLTDSTKKISLTDLEKALKNNEFVVYYQPYFSTTNNEIGLEALIRWNHSEYGLLFPAQFLDLAEKTGFILKIESWVLNKAIADASKLKQMGIPIMSLSVNISATQLDLDSFPKEVEQVLAKYNFNPSVLTLEITERYLIESSSLNTINKLKNKGVRISIDDFGVAYSSLNYLKSLPVDELKIDRSFIADITSDKNNKNIVEVIVNLGNKLNLTVVAEGVETKEQLEMLKQMNCNRVQGFYFSKPIPLNSFVSKYKDGTLHKV